VAYAFGLQGPCNGIDTACSSSLVRRRLVARHMTLYACQFTCSAVSANVQITSAMLTAASADPHHVAARRPSYRRCAAWTCSVLRALLITVTVIGTGSKSVQCKHDTCKMEASATSSLHILSACAQVAAHNAHRGILGGEADAALAAGVNVMLWQETTAGICQLQVRAWPQVTLAHSGRKRSSLASSVGSTRHLMGASQRPWCTQYSRFTRRVG